MLLVALLVPLLIGMFGCGAVTPGGDVSGVPDSTVGDWRWPSGTISTGGRIDLFREQNWTQPPSGRVGAR